MIGQYYLECTCNTSLCNAQIPNLTAMSSMPPPAVTIEDVTITTFTFLEVTNKTDSEPVSLEVNNISLVSLIVILPGIATIIVSIVIITVYVRRRVQSCRTAELTPTSTPQVFLDSLLSGGEFRTVHRGRRNEETVAVKVSHSIFSAYSVLYITPYFIADIQ